MKAVHEPDPEFLDHLEWQVKTALRREERFAEPAGRRARTFVQTCALVLLSVTVGAAGAVAADRLQDEELRELLMTQKGIQVELAERRVGQATDGMEQAEKRLELGVVSKAELRDARRWYLEERLALDLLLLERQEIEASGRRPLEAFSAPLIGGRDFVSDRLELERAFAQELLGILREERERTAALFEGGLVGPSALEDVELHLGELRVQLEELELLLALRREFLMGKRSAEEIELLRIEATLLVQLRPLRSERDLLTGRLDSLRKRAEEMTAEVEQREARWEETGDQASWDEAREKHELVMVELQEAQRGAGLRLDEVDAQIQLLELELRILQAELWRDDEAPPQDGEAPQEPAPRRDER